MSSIYRYALVDRENNQEDYEYESYQEAEREARRRDCAVIELEYEYADSSLVWTPDGGIFWPPERGGE